MTVNHNESNLYSGAYFDHDVRMEIHDIRLIFTSCNQEQRFVAKMLIYAP
jgi:hypothetical protein